MTTIKLTFEAESLQKFLDRVTTNDKVLDTALMATGKHLESKLATYPPVRQQKQSQYWSDKQRRAFFAKLNAGEISVPYNRTGDAGRSWTTKPNGNQVIVGNNRKYAPYLYDPEKQANYHKGNWKTTKQVIDANRGELVTMLDKTIEKLLNS
jgi:hypothetical protein